MAQDCTELHPSYSYRGSLLARNSALSLKILLQLPCSSHWTAHIALVARHCSLMQLLLSTAQGASYQVYHVQHLVAGWVFRLLIMSAGFKHASCFMHQCEPRCIAHYDRGSCMQQPMALMTTNCEHRRMQLFTEARRANLQHT